MQSCEEFSANLYILLHRKRSSYLRVISQHQVRTFYWAFSANYVAPTFLIIGWGCLWFRLRSISSHTSPPGVVGVGMGGQLSASLRRSPCRTSSVFSLCSSPGSTEALAMLWRRRKVTLQLISTARFRAAISQGSLTVHISHLKTAAAIYFEFMSNRVWRGWHKWNRNNVPTATNRINDYMWIVTELSLAVNTPSTLAWGEWAAEQWLLRQWWSAYPRSHISPSRTGHSPARCGSS